MLFFKLGDLAGYAHPLFEERQKLIVHLVYLRPVIL
jgi:hypothetical protein